MCTRNREKHWKVTSIHSLIDRWQFVDVPASCAHIISINTKIIQHPTMKKKEESVTLPFPTNFLSFLFCWRCYCCCCCFCCFCCCTINQSTASKLCENSIQMRLIIKSCIFLERFDAIYFGLAPLYIIGIVIEKRCANGIITVFSFLLACLLFSLLLLLVFKLKFYVSEYMMYSI